MYKLDTEAAKQADQKGGGITEAGKYIGEFTRAEVVVSSEKGTQGVEFTFKSNDGLEANYLTLWTKRANGEELYGYKTLMAIMACLKVRSASPVQTTIEKYDHESGAMKMMQANVLPELMGKQIGLLICMEEYEKQDKTRKWKPVIYAPFEAATGFTASEILNKAQKPETMEKMLLTMSNRPLRTPSVQQASSDFQKPEGALGGNLDDFNDDIPW